MQKITIFWRSSGELSKRAASSVEDRRSSIKNYEIINELKNYYKSKVDYEKDFYLVSDVRYEMDLVDIKIFMKLTWNIYNLIILRK